MVSLFLLGLILSVVASIPYGTHESFLSKKEQIKNDCIETAEVMLNGAMLGSVTYFGLEINSYKG